MVSVSLHLCRYFDGCQDIAACAQHTRLMTVQVIWYSSDDSFTEPRGSFSSKSCSSISVDGIGQLILRYTGVWSGSGMHAHAGIQESASYRRSSDGT